MLTKTVQHGGLCVEVGELRWGDERHFKALIPQLAAHIRQLADCEANPDDCDENLKDRYLVALDNDLYSYVYALAQTRSSSGFATPTIKNRVETILDGFNAADELPARFLKDWIETAYQLREGVDPDLKPAEGLTEDQKKAKASAKKG